MGIGIAYYSINTTTGPGTVAQNKYSLTKRENDYLTTDNVTIEKCKENKKETVIKISKLKPRNYEIWEMSKAAPIPPPNETTSQVGDISKSFVNGEPLYPETITTVEKILQKTAFISPDEQVYHFFTNNALLMEKEKERHPNKFYLDKQKFISSDMRIILITWLMEVCREYFIHRETFHLAIHYLDIFLGKNPSVVSKVNLEIIDVSPDPTQITQKAVTQGPTTSCIPTSESTSISIPLYTLETCSPCSPCFIPFSRDTMISNHGSPIEFNERIIHCDLKPDPNAFIKNYADSSKLALTDSIFLTPSFSLETDDSSRMDDHDDSVHLIHLTDTRALNSNKCQGNSDECQEIKTPKSNKCQKTPNSNKCQNTPNSNKRKRTNPYEPSPDETDKRNENIEKNENENESYKKIKMTNEKKHDFQDLVDSLSSIESDDSNDSVLENKNEKKEIKKKTMGKSESLTLNLNLNPDLSGSRLTIDSSNFQLVGLTCLMIASKFGEIYITSPTDFAKQTGGAHTARELVIMEKLILQDINWTFEYPTSFEWLNIYIVQCVYYICNGIRTGTSTGSANTSTGKGTCTDNLLDLNDFEKHYVANSLLNTDSFLRMMEYLDMALVDIKFLKYYPSELAAAVLLFEHVYTRHVIPYNVITRVTGYGEYFLNKIVHDMKYFTQLVYQGIPPRVGSEWPINIVGKIQNNELHTMQLHHLQYSDTVGGNQGFPSNP